MSAASEEAVSADAEFASIARQREILNAALRIGKMAIWTLEVASGIVTPLSQRR